MANQITPNPSVPSQVVAEVKFPKFINNLGIIPTSYKDSMSYYECLAWLCKYLEETVIPTVNENGNAVEELQALYVELNEYVTNYFDNLDVQEEINNKLDEMVESGDFQEILEMIINNATSFNLSQFKNDTNTWQEALEYIYDNYDLPKYTITLPKNQAIDTDLIINKKNTTLKNGYFENAGLILNYTESETDKFCNIENIQFKGTKNFGIKIINAFIPSINNCLFNNKNLSEDSYGILIISNDQIFQNSRRVIITNNQFNGCDYGLYVDNPNEIFGASGDIIFSNNQVDVLKGGIYSVGVDGHVINSNVFYMPGYSQRNMTKVDNIYIKYSNFTEITGNSLFEAGRNGIHIEDTPSFIIANNNIDWCGQNTLASGIYAKITSSRGEFISNISNNLITYPTKSGIEIESDNNAGLLITKGNNVTAPGLARYYYGLVDITSIQHYGIESEGIKGCIFTDNINYPTFNDKIDNVNNYVDSFTIGASKYISAIKSNIQKRDITVTNLSNNINLDGVYTNININATGTFDFSKIQNAITGQKITIVQYNTSSVTWAENSSVKYKHDAVLTTYQYAVKEFVFGGNFWIQTSESNYITPT